MADIGDALQQQVRQAIADRTPLEIRAGGSKDFYGRAARPSSVLSLAEHSGVVNYQADELTLTARAGTPLSELRALLAEHRQQLPFEPPGFADTATLGGAVACGFSGPARPFAGAVRDHVLGVRLINGQGQVLRFGGEVMKNVAGYDVSRLQVGAMGTLGVLLDVSLKLLPAPAAERTLMFESDASEALHTIAALRVQYLPISGWCHAGGRAFLRLSGSARDVDQVAARLGGETVSRCEQRWADLREHRLPFFDDPRPLWRLSLPPGTGPLSAPGDQLLDWAGCQRWLLSEAPASEIQSIAAAAGGHATRFRGGDGAVFQQPQPALAPLQARIKASLDPHGLFNPGRLNPDW